MPKQSKGNFRSLCGALKKKIEYFATVRSTSCSMCLYLEWRQALLCGGEYKVWIQGDGFVSSWVSYI